MKKKNENDKKFKEIENDLIKKEKTLIAQQNILKKEEFEKKLKIYQMKLNEYRSE